jgi:hypothetical protein
MNQGRTKEFFRREGPTFLFYLFSNYNYSLIQYQQITINNYTTNHNSYIHITHILHKDLL